MTIGTNIEERVHNYLSQMSLEEKVSQLVHNSKAIERLGINKYNWWNECLHGVARAGVATVFPQAIGMAASWNVNLMAAIANVISDEARAKHHEYDRQGKHEIYQGLTYWSPNINIFRDPRWGRGMETYGEDPYLTSRMAVPFIKGLQGNHPQYLKLVATPKHFAVHSGPEYSRHYFNAKPTDRDLWETYLPAFEACIKEANAYSIMGAYNRLYDEACCASNLLLNKILRQKWNFEGFVVSDCGAITDIFEYHKITKTPAEAAALAVKMGTDLCCGHEYCDLVEAVMMGLIKEPEIDLAVARLLKAKIKLGMFDAKDNVPYASIPFEVVDCEKHREMAHKAALESIVLLKNENNLLPLTQKYKTIAVIGPNADSTDVVLGNYHGTPTNPISLLQGLQNIAGNNYTIIHERGCELAEDLPFLEILPSKQIFTQKLKTENGLTIEYFNNNKAEGVAVKAEVIEQLNHKLFNNLSEIVSDTNNFSIKITGYLCPELTGKHAIGTGGLTSMQLFIDDNLLTEFNTIWEPEKIYESIQLEAGKTYKLTLLISNLTSEAHVQKLLWAYPDNNREQRALKVAMEADVIVLAMGLSPQLEGEEMPVHVDGFKQGDRLNIELPKTQNELMQKITALNKPTVLVLFNGCALAINHAKENIPAIVEAWYGGQAAGNAIAEVLFGKYNPAGRLPITFYKSTDQLPAFEDYSMKGRTYRYFKGETLFDFGFGLSYTAFKYSNLNLPNTINATNQINISVNVSNTGNFNGDEVVQLYISRSIESDTHPIRSLQAFNRVHIKKGESQTINFNLVPKQFASINSTGESIIEPGVYSISVGGQQPNNLAITNNLVVVGSVEVI